MDGYWTVIATYSPTTPPAVDAVATGSCLMIPSVMPDSREPVPTSSGFAISRRGRPGELAATRAAGEEGCRVRAFEDADVAPRAPHCARIITSHQNEEAEPRRHMPTETRPGLTVSPQRSPNRPVRASVARSRAALDESRGAISTLSTQTVALRSSLVM